MARLIDADALNRTLRPIAMDLSNEYGSLGGAVSGVIKHIDNAPDVDAVEVVRCKDCKYFKTWLCQDKYNYDNWFCADGKRKDGDENG